MGGGKVKSVQLSLGKGQDQVNRTGLDKKGYFSLSEGEGGETEGK